MDIKQLVKQSGKTRSEIAKEAGVSLGFLSHLESGRRQVGTDTIAALATALGVHPKELRPDIAAIFERTA